MPTFVTEIKKRNNNNKDKDDEEIASLLKEYINPMFRTTKINQIPRSLLPFNPEILSKDKSNLEFQNKLYQFCNENCLKEHIF